MADIVGKGGGFEVVLPPTFDWDNWHNAFPTNCLYEDKAGKIIAFK